ncbi:MAG: magnesium chelatase [Thermoanaerobaculia bacterium]|nr:magnesium chelatase [Thermoanaerobaculia bacterium]
MTPSTKPSSLGELKASGYRPKTVREELRANLRRKLATGEPLFPGVLGYDRTVIPGIVNAILAGHDLILLGLRGQAKTRLLRSLTDLLDPEIPVLAGSELNDDPIEPISVPGQKLVAELGDDAPVEWLSRELRYNEKLATPDVSIADLLGDIDPIKAATQKLTFADPEVIHFGIVPRTNRGIFAVNELPDLAPRIQVGLLNLLEERDLQIRGFPVRIPLDIMLVFSANPEDYTNRGSIITPLKDRISSQILTHYPADPEVAAQITAQEAWTDRGHTEAQVVIPGLVKLMIEEIAFAARDSELVDQSSGVSARMSISALELLWSNLERRALATGDHPVYPRVCDLHMLLPAITGKVEMVYEGEQQGAEVVAKKLIGEAVKNVFVDRLPDVPKGIGSGGEEDRGRYADIVRWFAEGGMVTVTDEIPFGDYYRELQQVPHLMDLAKEHAPSEDDAVVAFTAELILEGLHQHLKLAREDLDSHITYKEMMKFQLLRPNRPSRGDRGVN